MKGQIVAVSVASPTRITKEKRIFIPDLYLVLWEDGQDLCSKKIKTRKEINELTVLEEFELTVEFVALLRELEGIERKVRFQLLHNKSLVYAG